MIAATRELLEQSLRAFGAGSPPPVDARFGRSTIEVIAACYQSAAEGRRVVLAESGHQLRGRKLG
jgi:hypothetical protein